MPANTSLAARVTEIIVDNRDATRDRAEDFVTRLPGRLERIGELIEHARPLLDTVMGLIDRFGRMKTALVGATAVLASPIVSPLLSLTASLVLLTGTVAGAIIKLLPLAGRGYSREAGPYRDPRRGWRVDR